MAQFGLAHLTGGQEAAGSNPAAPKKAVNVKLAR